MSNEDLQEDGVGDPVGYRDAKHLKKSLGCEGRSEARNKARFQADRRCGTLPKTYQVSPFIIM